MMPTRGPVFVTALGVSQIFAWGTSFYFPAVFAEPIVKETLWPLSWIVGGTSIGLLVAGLIAPRVGRLIDRHGGRPVLGLSSCLFAAGLAGIGLAPNLPCYLAAWIVLGGGMGTGLYDAVFAAIGKVLGNQARSTITNLTLFGGFASTVCWPLSSLMIESIGWRAACFVYAALHLVVSLPLQLAVMPRAAPSAEPTHTKPQAAQPATAQNPPARPWLTIALLALVLTISSAIGSIVVVHLLIFLQARGADATAAVAIGALFGPAQVGARLIERIFGQVYHPIWTIIASCLFMLLGLALLCVGVPILVIAVLLYGGGYGIMWIARGTLPLALFGPARYAVLMGRLAFPSLIAQALAPSAGAWLIENYGSDATMVILTGFAAANVLLVAALWTCVPRPQ